MSGGWQPAPKYEQIVALSARPSCPRIAPPGVFGLADTTSDAVGASAEAFCLAASRACSPIGERSFSIAGFPDDSPAASCGSDETSTVDCETTLAWAAFAVTEISVDG